MQMFLVVIVVADRSDIRKKLKGQRSSSESRSSVVVAAWVSTSVEVGMMTTCSIVSGPEWCA